MAKQTDDAGKDGIESPRDRKARHDRERRARVAKWARLLDDPTLVGRVAFRRDDSEIGRVDHVTAVELEGLRLDFERDPGAIIPLHAAVSLLFSHAVTRASSTDRLAAPQWPTWVVYGVQEVLWQLCIGDGRRSGRAGRHAKEWTRRAADERDYERAHAVKAARDAGLSWRAAYRQASRQLKDTPAAGSEKVMQQAHKRVQERFPRDPRRYRQ